MRKILSIQILPNGLSNSQEQIANEKQTGLLLHGHAYPLQVPSSRGKQKGMIDDHARENIGNDLSVTRKNPDLVWFTYRECRR